ncbi:hypothetical protein [Candidatus Nitrosocosmicus franklandus]|uniref:Uncharacterized protein n=1 Tax=Candidatus Nitrosocosmicus franklandianus TaxID=1798806 RepID=A0A484IIG0_9ARCH|nr:hypothetical protein [Candidatus Nitrosocosmicus franklandus]VFJ15445.1 conserved protein of unknown function [Candidatus Nitrosocosmicus franklandus]
MKRINPFTLLEKYICEGTLDKKFYSECMKRIKIVEDAVGRIEKITRLEYPDYYVEPALTLSSSEMEFDQYSVLYARTIPVCTRQNQIRIIIQISLPLILYGLKGTIHAVMAHEFTHYLDLIRKIINLDISSDHIPQTGFEMRFADNEKTIDYNLVFKDDRSLKRMLNTKFNHGLIDPRLDKKTKTNWIEKKLPIKHIMIADNYTSLPFQAIVNTPIAEQLKIKLLEWR